MSTLHVVGIILSIQNVGEADRRIWCYTERHGKLELFAKSARRMESKLSPHIEPLTIADCYIVRGRTDHLAGIERRERFLGLRASLERLTHAAWAALLVHRLTKPDHPEPRIFHLLTTWFSFVEIVPRAQIPHRFRLLFMVHLLDYLGYRQEFTRCLRCKIQESDSWAYVPRDGGILCASCRRATDDASIPIEPGERRALHDMHAGEPSFTPERHYGISNELASKILGAAQDEHLGGPLPTELLLSHLLVVRG